ncbi:MAG: GumC family protein [Desulfobacteraceae bacterium]|nr:GumC family protein [Desulfobacteraceae bacterium]
MDTSTQQPARVSLRDILFIIFSKMHVLIGTFLTIVVVTVGLCFMVDPVYEVSATVLVKPFVDPGLQLQLTPTSLNSFPLSREDINSEIKIMNSEELLRQIVKNLGTSRPPEPEKLLSRLMSKLFSKVRNLLVRLRLSVQPDPVDTAVLKLKNKLDIEPITMSNMFRVALKGNDPANITKIVNSLLEGYIDRHIQVYKAKGGVDFFSKQAELFSERLMNSERDLGDFQKKWSIIKIQDQRAENLDLLKLITNNRSLVRGKIAAKKTKLSQLTESMQHIGEITAMTEELRGNSMLEELAKALLPLLVEKERIAQLYPESSIEYQDVHRQVKEMKQAIRKEQRRIMNGIQVDLASLISHEKSLASDIQDVEVESLSLTEREIALDRLTREVEQNKKNYLLYQDKTEAARIMEQKDSTRVANVAIASRAHEPTVPIFPKKILMGFISIIVGLITGLGCTFAAYYLDHTVKRPEDIVQNCEVPVLSDLGIVKSL